MKSIAEFLERRERKRLAVIGLVFVLSLLFLVFIALGQRRGYYRATGDLEAVRAEARSADQVRGEAKAEWLRWDEARIDLETLHRDYFYHRDQGISKLRLDLQQLFNGQGLRPSDLKFDYADYEKDKAQKISATFTFSGSYELLRRFLFSVEEFPKLLFVERITFVSIDPASGSLNLKIALAAYHEL